MHKDLLQGYSRYWMSRSAILMLLLTLNAPASYLTEEETLVENSSVKSSPLTVTAKMSPSAKASRAKAPKQTELQPWVPEREAIIVVLASYLVRYLNRLRSWVQSSRPPRSALLYDQGGVARNLPAKHESLDDDDMLAGAVTERAPARAAQASKYANIFEARGCSKRAHRETVEWGLALNAARQDPIPMLNLPRTNPKPAIYQHCTLYHLEQAPFAIIPP